MPYQHMPIPQWVADNGTDGDARGGAIRGLTERDRVTGPDQVEQRGSFDFVRYTDLETRGETCEGVVLAGAIVVRPWHSEILAGQVGEGDLGSTGERVLVGEQYEDRFG